MLTAIVITKNEEKMLRVCLESIKWVDEIIVADNGSTDSTLEIAKKYTKQIITFKGQDFAALRNRAITEAKGDWVLYIDADERVLEPLRVEIKEIMRNSEKSAYALSRKNIIFGKEVDYEPYKNDWMIKLFKRSDFDTWVGKVHEYGKFRGQLGYTKNSLLHLTHRNLDQIVLKSLDWSNIDARLRLEAKHPQMSAWRFLRILVSETFVQGIIKKGFFNGTVGVMDSMLQVFSLFMTYVRLWELQQSKPLDEIYEETDKKLEENGFRY